MWERIRWFLWEKDFSGGEWGSPGDYLFSYIALGVIVIVVVGVLSSVCLALG